jgi:catalase
MNPIKNLPESDALSIIKNAKGTFEGRKLGVLVTDGVDEEMLQAFRDAAEQEGAEVAVIGPRISGIVGSNKTAISANEAIDGGPSVLFDAVVLLPSEQGVETMKDKPPARDFVADAFAHCKFIAYNETGAVLLDKAGVTPDDGVVAISDAADAAAFLELCRTLRFFEREEAQED